MLLLSSVALISLACIDYFGIYPEYEFGAKHMKTINRILALILMCLVIMTIIGMLVDKMVER